MVVVMVVMVVFAVIAITLDAGVGLTTLSELRTTLRGLMWLVTNDMLLKKKKPLRDMEEVYGWILGGIGLGMAVSPDELSH